jgi:3-isopropylmalate/(R)-2-methylmalate dehydratase small subunit
VIGRFAGRVRRVGDHVNSDYIIASKRKRDTLDESQLKRYLFETLDPSFAASVQPGDVLVAGRNFGCGSAMEVAATVLNAAGFSVVIAETFARAFYRNAVNNGLTPLLAPTSGFQEGDSIVVDVRADGATITSARTGARVEAAALPPAMAAILEAGGIVPYVKQHGRLPS